MKQNHWLKASLMFCTLIPLLTASSFFCSVKCAPNQCSAVQFSSACTGCPTYWTPSGSVCAVDTSTGWSLWGRSYWVSPTGSYVVDHTPALFRSCGSYYLDGWFSCSANQEIFISAGVTQPHYQVRVEAMLWFKDSSTLSTTENIMVTLGNVTNTRSIATYDTVGNQCLGLNQVFFRLGQTFNHTQKSTQIRFYLSNDVTDSSCTWGLAQMVLLTKLCHSYCRQCYGSTNTQCTDCKNAYYHLNDSCLTDCSTGYGRVTSNKTCVLCDQKCQQCQQSVTNCSSCTANGTNQAFLLVNQCLSTCPNTTFANSTTHTCDACNTTCQICPDSTECWLCKTGYGWLGSQCYDPCPQGYFLDGQNCTQCDAKCTTCNGSATNCSECTLNGTDKAYLLNNSCLSSCQNGTFPEQNPNVCSSCHSNCQLCSGSASSNCTSCSAGNVLSNTTCDSSCLAGYGDVSNSSTCVQCNISCIACAQSADNCSSCVTNGTNQAFLDSDLSYPQCATTCSNSSHFANPVTHECDPCDSLCTTCQTNSTYCFDCTTGNGWLNYTCYSTCPIGTFMDNGNCSYCDNTCSLCQGTSSNCSQCTTSGNDTAYLLNLTCHSDCPDPYFNDTNSGAGPNTCLACHVYCTSCYAANQTNCTGCNTNYTLSGETCATDCLEGYGPTNDPLVCLSCTSPCVNCSQTDTNCTSCESSPTQHYLLTNSTNGSCYSVCPDSYYVNSTSLTCEPCPSQCFTCDNETNCFECLSADGYLWFNFTCNSTCPDYYFDSNGVNCTSCQEGCLTCQVLDDNCTSCIESGDNRTYLLDFSCLSSCPIGYFEQNATATCGACDDNCYRCWDSDNRSCYQCSNSKVLSGSACLDACDTDYGVTSDPYICIECNSTICDGCTYNSTNCTACPTNTSNDSYLYAYSDSYSSCVESCPNGTYPNTTNFTCLTCPVGCSECIANDNCTVCETNYFMHNDSCVTSCPAGYFSNDSLCVACHQNCQVCLDDTADNCTQCTFNGTDRAYLLNTTCYSSCPNNTYEDSNSNNGPNVCLTCPENCTRCESPSNCTECENITDMLLYNGSCVIMTGGCPNGTVFHSATSQCVNTTTGGVFMSLSVSFVDSNQDSIIIELQFSRPLDTSTFDTASFQSIAFTNSRVSISNFNTTYTWTNDTSYSITLTPQTYIIMKELTVAVTTKSPSPPDESLDGMPFNINCYEQTAQLTNWTLIRRKEMSQSEKQVVDSMSRTSDAIAQYTTAAGAQQINKAGVGALLFPGAQLTSSSLLMKSDHSENLYEGSRMWSSFVYFETPKYQQNGSKTKYVFSPTVQEVTSSARLLSDQSARILFNLNDVSWQFQRTGFSTFFIFDCYMQVLIILICWIMVGVCSRVQRCVSFNLMDRVWSLFHRLHEITLFYLSLALVLEWLYFDSSSVIRLVSLALCLLFNLYYFVYQMYIFYQLIEYPTLQLGSPRLQQLTTHYGYFLRNIAYCQPEPWERQWSLRQLLRPYNYHLLSFWKKFMMIAAVPLFYEHPTAAAAVLVTLQLVEMVRFVLVWPFAQKWRNVVRLILQTILLVFFLTVLTELILQDRINSNQQNDTVEAAYDAYYAVGWIGVVTVFVFNLAFVVLALIDCCLCCRSTNSQQIRNVRRDYYYQKISKYQNSTQMTNQQEEIVDRDLLDLWVARGDLNEKWIDKVGASGPTTVEIESYDISKMGESFAVEISCTTKLAVGRHRPIRSQMRVVEEFKGTVRVTSASNPTFYKLIKHACNYHDPSRAAINIKLKSQASILLEQHPAGSQITTSTLRQVRQSIQLVTRGSREIRELPRVMRGFPISRQVLSPLLSSNHNISPDLK